MRLSLPFPAGVRSQREFDRYGTLSYSELEQPARLYRSIVRLPAFERSARDLLSEQEHRWLDVTLAQQPGVAPVIPGTGGVRKLRVALKGRGKRGVVRVIYYYRGAKERVYLILAYAKTTRTDLTAGERREIRKLTAMLEAEQ